MRISGSGKKAVGMSAEDIERLQNGDKLVKQPQVGQKPISQGTSGLRHTGSRVSRTLIRGSRAQPVRHY